MAAEFIRTEQRQGIMTITLHRPDKRNAMNAQLIDELSEALQLYSDTATARVLLINGSGEHFCAGADIAWMQSVANSSPDENNEDAQKLADLMFQLYSCQKPTLVLAHGTTLGGGLGLLSACDIAIVASNAVFGFSEVKIGIVPAVISPYVMSAIGERAAHYYFLTGERFDAHEAFRIGLAHKVCERKELLEVGTSLAKTLLENGPHAMTAAKQLIRRVSCMPISESLAQMTAEYLANLRTTPEAQEGLRAYLEKRAPHWA